MSYDHEKEYVAFVTKRYALNTPVQECTTIWNNYGKTISEQDSGEFSSIMKRWQTVRNMPGHLNDTFSFIDYAKVNEFTEDLLLDTQTFLLNTLPLTEKSHAPNQPD
jgi:hypothetical protein